MNNTSILVIDDEREVSDAIQRDLRKWSREEGLTIQAVNSGSEALDTLERRGGDFAIAMCDIQMPGLKGNSLIRIISERWPDIVPIVLTGNMQLEYVQDFLDSGIFSFLTKPWDRDRLILDLRRALQLHDLRKGQKATRAIVDRELVLAHEFQDKWLKREFPTDPRVALDIHREVGGSLDFTGDFLDLRRLDADRLLLVLADVAGHGLQASFVTSLLKSIMDADLPLVFENRALSPSSFAEWINKRLCGHLRSVECAFVALLVLELDLKNDLCRWVNAGQPPFVALCEGGPVVSSAAELPACLNENLVYHDREIKFPAGSQLVVATDGLFPSGLNVAGYETKDYFEILASCMARRSGAEGMAGELRARAGLDQPVDDLTLVKISRT